MLEKDIPFELQVEIPWHKEETATPKYNPLEKLPVLLFPDDREPIYDSSLIQDYIVQKYSDKGPRLITDDPDFNFKLKQIQVLSQGVMDAVVLAFFEKSREGKSEAWYDRQMRKVVSGLRAMEELAKKKPQGSDFMFQDQLTIADIAVVCAVGFCDFNGAVEGWKEKYPQLAAYFQKLDERESFKTTRPVMLVLPRQYDPDHFADSRSTGLTLGRRRSSERHECFKIEGDHPLDAPLPVSRQLKLRKMNLLLFGIIENLLSDHFAILFGLDKVWSIDFLDITNYTLANMRTETGFISSF